MHTVQLFFVLLELTGCYVITAENTASTESSRHETLKKKMTALTERVNSITEELQSERKKRYCIEQTSK